MFCDFLWAKNLDRFICGGSASSCELVSSSKKNWFPCSHSIFSDFLFVLVSDLFCFSFYIVFPNLSGYLGLYSFSIAFCFSFSIIVRVILLHFDSVLVLVILTKISLSIAILFYALVYHDDDDDDAGLSSGAGTKWEAHVRREA